MYGTGKEDDWLKAAGALGGLSPREKPGNYSLLTGLASVPSGSSIQPVKTSSLQISRAEERFNKRLRRLDEILPVTAGRTIPDDEDLIIGGARRLKLAVLFLDICGFSKIDSEDEGQDQVLKLLNLFMAEMLTVVKEHSGVFEKNTGDGLMAYFGEQTLAENVSRAVDAAITMHCYNDQVISPRLRAITLPEVKFRVAIDAGGVTIANVGVRGDHHSLVAIGNVPNLTCKMMRLIPNGGIALGNTAYSLLPSGLQKESVQLGTVDGFVFKGTTTPYPAWELKYRAPDFRGLGSSLNAILGGL